MKINTLVIGEMQIKIKKDTASTSMMITKKTDSNKYW